MRLIEMERDLLQPLCSQRTGSRGSIDALRVQLRQLDPMLEPIPNDWDRLDAHQDFAKRFLLARNELDGRPDEHRQDDFRLAVARGGQVRDRARSQCDGEPRCHS